MLKCISTAAELEADRPDAERHQRLMQMINQAPVRGPEHWPGTHAGDAMPKAMPNSLKPWWKD